MVLYILAAEMDRIRFIHYLIENGIYLRHRTRTRNYYQILEDGVIKTNIPYVQDPEGISLVPATFFQLHKGIKCREWTFEEKQMEIFVSPLVLLDRAFVLHPSGWHFGILNGGKEAQYHSEDPSRSNISLDKVKDLIVYEYRNWGAIDTLNEVMILDSVPTEYIMAAC